MTLRLMDRLARLEGAHTVTGGPADMPREMMHAWLRAVAVALGGYPQARRETPSYTVDSLGDGFARGLGYIDRADMEARATADSNDWQERIVQAITALRERYRADTGLDAQADDDDALARAVAFYGSQPEATEPRI